MGTPYMIELILIACLGQECKKVHYGEPFAMPISCAVQSQIIAADWVAGHPNYVIAKTVCQPIGARSEET
jgi:hypothetical protein